MNFGINSPSLKSEITRMEDAECGAIIIDEWPDYLGIYLENAASFSVRALGNLMVFSHFPKHTYGHEATFRGILCILNNAEVSKVVNQKFDNDPEMGFAAGLFSDDSELRCCVVLPTDTLEMALDRFYGSWPRQAVKYNRNLNGNYDIGWCTTEDCERWQKEKG